MSKPPRAIARRLVVSMQWFAFFCVLILAQSLHAGPITVPNASFELPVTFFATPNLESWQRTPEPSNWDTNVSGPWENLIGVFKNTPVGNFDHIDNCHSNQAMWLFANPDAGIFQDYDTVDWNDPSPTHAFDAIYEVGKSYQLTAGLLVGGKGNNGGVTPGATVEFSLYYRDAASNRVTVAAITITNSLEVFTNSTHLLDFSVTTPVVRPTDAWAGKHIGISLISTPAPELNAEGYWDLDHVRLSSTLSPSLRNPIHTNNQFQFTVQSEPGMILEILATTDATLPAATWTSLGLLTNSTGVIPFIDTAANFNQRFYQARQMP